MDEKRFTLRMDRTLFGDISDLAAQHRRSIAKEIECAVAEYVIKAKRQSIMSGYDAQSTDAEDAKQRLEKMNELLDKYDQFLGGGI